MLLSLVTRAHMQDEYKRKILYKRKLYTAIT